MKGDHLPLWLGVAVFISVAAILLVEYRINRPGERLTEPVKTTPRQVIDSARLPIKIIGVYELRDRDGSPRSIIHHVEVPLTSTDEDLAVAKAKWSVEAEKLLNEGWRTVVWCENAEIGESKNGDFTTWSSKSVLFKRLWCEGKK